MRLALHLLLAYIMFSLFSTCVGGALEFGWLRAARISFVSVALFMATVGIVAWSLSTVFP